MTYYYKKRRNLGLTKSELANQLNIGYDRYSSIEKGEVKMPANLIDKFNEIINKGKVNDIERLNRQQMVEQWFEEMQQDRSKFKQKMQEFNINSYDELGHLLGYSHGAIICAYITGKRNCGFDVKNKIYSFFENELNIQKPKGRKYERGATNEYQELYDWYKSFDIKTWLKNNNYTIKTFALECGLAQSVAYYFINPTHEDFRPNKKTIEVIKDFIEGVQPIEEPIVEVEPVVEENETDTTKNKLITKYEHRVGILEQQIKSIKDKIESLNKDLTAISYTKGIYEELLNEIKTL